MQLTSDAVLKGPVWAESIDRLNGHIFETNWDIYALCITIGMFYDKQIKSDDMVPQDYDETPRYVPRNVLGHAQNEALLDFMFQTALITTKLLDFDEEKRLELAFGSTEKVDFNPISFLTEFANYGVTKLHEQLSDVSDIETMESMMTFLNGLYENGVNELEADEELSE